MTTLRNYIEDEYTAEVHFDDRPPVVVEYAGQNYDETLECWLQRDEGGQAVDWFFTPVDVYDGPCVTLGPGEPLPYDGEPAHWNIPRSRSAWATAGNAYRSFAFNCEAS